MIRRLKFTLLDSVILPAVSAIILAASAAAGGVPPPNDLCANAIEVELGSVAFSTFDATAAAPGVCAPIGNDIWYKFTSTFTGQLLVSTCNNANFDTIIAVYSGCNCAQNVLVSCNDNSSGCPGGTSRALVNVQANTCYRIRVGGFQGTSGMGVLTLSCGNPETAACADQILTGFEPDDRFGFAVSGNGRINGDVIRDVLVGAPLNDHTGVNTGRAYAYKGPDAGALYTLTGAAAGDSFGHALKCDCDVNGDGRADLVIGAPLNDEQGLNAGKIFAFSGFDGTLLWSRMGEAAGDRLGFSVACAGDVNSDGFQDVIVGAPYKNAKRGRVYVLNGQNGAVLKKRNGQTAGEFFGWAVAGIGDANNDGKDDYAVGAPTHSSVFNKAGRVTIISGATHAVLQRLNGDAAGDRFGTSLAGARFSVGSHWAFLAVGAPLHNGGGSNSGRVRLYSRNISFPATNPCNKLFCTLFTINGGNAGDQFGASVALGNAAGNAFADLIVGAPKADFAGSNSGAVYVFNGAGGPLVRRFFGEAPGDEFGTSVAFAGDVNNDGIGDVIIGAPKNDIGGANAGRAYVFFMGTAPAMAPALAAAIDEARDPFTLPEQLIINPGDVNGDGAINVDDLLDVLSQWGQCAQPCSADLDDDGVVNAADLLTLLGNL